MRRAGNVQVGQHTRDCVDVTDSVVCIAVSLIRQASSCKGPASGSALNSSFIALRICKETLLKDNTFANYEELQDG